MTREEAIAICRDNAAIQALEARSSRWRLWLIAIGEKDTVGDECIARLERSAAGMDDDGAIQAAKSFRDKFRGTLRPKAAQAEYVAAALRFLRLEDRASDGAFAHDEGLRNVVLPWASARGTVAQEFRLYGARADLVILPEGEIVAVEIKANRDGLGRLPEQIQNYGKVCTSAWLATTKKHLEKAMGIIPEWWGVMEITSSGIQQIRNARGNPAPDAAAIARGLRKSEIIATLRRIGVKPPSTRQPRHKFTEALKLALTDVIELQREVSRTWRDEIARSLQSAKVAT